MLTHDLSVQTVLEQVAHKSQCLKNGWDVVGVDPQMKSFEANSVLNLRNIFMWR